MPVLTRPGFKNPALVFYTCECKIVCMNDRWYFFAVGVVVATAVFYLLSLALPGQSVFSPASPTGLVVKEAVRQDLDSAQKQGITLIGYSMPFDGKENLPEAVVSNGKKYAPTVVGFDELNAYTGVLKIDYLMSIGESKTGKFPVYLVRLGEKPVVEGVVVLDRAFPEGRQPFT